jgi:polyisoprenoid-binding protein YceI
MSNTSTELVGLVAGTWAIDPAHSEVSFTVRHLMVSKVRGTFTRFTGALVVAQDPTQSHAEATVEMASIDTRDENRDNHLRSGDFFEVDKYPAMTYRTSGLREQGDGYLVEGELTLHGVTRPVALEVEFNGVSSDPWGGTRAGFSATGEINRRDFGVDLSMPLDGGGVVVGDKVKIAIEIEAVLTN